VKIVHCFEINDGERKRIYERHTHGEHSDSIKLNFHFRKGDKNYKHNLKRLSRIFALVISKLFCLGGEVSQILQSWKLRVELH